MMRVLLKASVLCLLITAAVPVLAVTRPFTLVGRTDTARAHPEYPFQTYIGFPNQFSRLFRTGGTNGTCDAPVAPPTQASIGGSFRREVMGVSTRDANNLTVAECITVKFHGVKAGERYSVAVYTTDPHEDADPKENLLGYARDWVDGYGDVQFFSFRKPANVNQYYVVAYGIAQSTDFGYYVEISNSLATSSDFDGDGQTDSAVFRPSTGVWYILQSSNGTVRNDFFGSNGDVPLDGDFDGDGRSDTAVFRPSDGTWYFKRSSNNTFYGAYFGLGTDKPVPGDYDRDGITDIGAYRDGQWLISASSGMHNQYNAYTFGAPGDIPLSSQRK